MKMRILLVAGVLLLVTPMVFGHSGRTDANGGHTDSKTGKYHYHNSGSGKSAPTSSSGC